MVRKDKQAFDGIAAILAALRVRAAFVSNSPIESHQSKVSRYIYAKNHQDPIVGTAHLDAASLA